MTEDRSWIQPGAPVVVYTTGRTLSAVETTVLKVAEKSFTVVGQSDRFKLETLQSKEYGEWHHWRYAVTHPNSEKAKELRERVRVRGLYIDARSAVAKWANWGDRASLDTLNAAIIALEEYRAARPEEK